MRHALRTVVALAAIGLAPIAAAASAAQAQAPTQPKPAPRPKPPADPAPEPKPVPKPEPSPGKPIPPKPTPAPKPVEPVPIEPRPIAEPKPVAPTAAVRLSVPPAAAPPSAVHPDLTPSRLFRPGSALSPTVKTPEHRPVTLGDDGDWKVQAAQVGAMVGVFGALTALCAGGRCADALPIADLMPDFMKSTEGPAVDVNAGSGRPLRQAR